MAHANQPTDDLVEALAKKLYDEAYGRQNNQQKQRELLRDYATQLREPAENNAGRPASAAHPSFKLTEVSNYQGAVQSHKEGEFGHLSPEASEIVRKNLLSAAAHQDPGTRDRYTGKAAKAIKGDLLAKNGIPTDEKGLVTLARHEARAQVVMATRELGEKLGLNPVESSIVGQALARSLEKEGVKVMLSTAVDKTADLFKGTAAAASSSIGRFASMEKAFDSSVKWLGEHGVSKDKIKSLVGKHTGKFLMAMEVYQNPEVIRSAAQVLANSDSAYAVLKDITNNDDLRKAVGTYMRGAGEALDGTKIGKAVGAGASLVGAVMREEDQIGRQVFRAAMSVIGGAAGGVAAGTVSAGIGSFVGAAAGASVGTAVADKILNKLEELNFIEPTKDQNLTSKDYQESRQTIADYANDKKNEKLAELQSGNKMARQAAEPEAEKSRDNGREFVMTYAKS